MVLIDVERPYSVDDGMSGIWVENDGQSGHILNLSSRNELSAFCRKYDLNMVAGGWMELGAK